MYENCADHLRNNLRLNVISVLIFFQYYFKINRNQLVATCGLDPNKCFKILNLTFKERILVTRNFRLSSNFRDFNGIRDMPISIEYLT